MEQHDDGVTRRAEAVSYDDTVEGPITAGSIDLVDQSFVVLGQTVIVDAATSFDVDVSLRDLDEPGSMGDFVEVSGLLANWRAGSWSGPPASSASTLAGTSRCVVSSTASTRRRTFVINGQMVNYGRVRRLDAPGGVISQWRVRGGQGRQL